MQHSERPTPDSEEAYRQHHAGMARLRIVAAAHARTEAMAAAAQRIKIAQILRESPQAGDYATVATPVPFSLK